MPVQHQSSRRDFLTTATTGLALNGLSRLAFGQDRAPEAPRYLYFPVVTPNFSSGNSELEVHDNRSVRPDRAMLEARTTSLVRFR